MAGPSIGRPTDVRRGTSPIYSIDRYARGLVPNFKTASVRARLDAVFNAFVHEFRSRGWHYTAGSLPFSGAHLLGGVTNASSLEQQFPGFGASLDCGHIADMLKIAFEAIVAPAEELQFTPSVIYGSFVTRKMGVLPPGVAGEFRCIDLSVYGNVRTVHTTYQAERRCLFTDHFALRLGREGVIYDPCLVSICTNKESIVEAHLNKDPRQPDILARAGFFGSHRVRYQVMRTESPTGFTAGYLKLA